MKAEQHHPQEYSPRHISRIAVVGMGQTGRMFADELSGTTEEQILGVTRKNWSEMEGYQPQLIIAATPNPADEVMQHLAQSAPEKAIIVLPQNGVSIIPLAQKICAEKDIYLVRASLLTAVAEDTSGDLRYRREKKAIGLAPVGDAYEQTVQAVELFRAAGFRTQLYKDAKSMEWTKLLLNTIGATSSITRLTPLETFGDEELFSLELQGIIHRMVLLQQNGISLVNFPGYSYVRALNSMVAGLQHLPSSVAEKTVLKLAGHFQGQIASLIAKGRGNLPSATGRAIEQGKQNEAYWYHQPFVDLSSGDLSSPLDETILEIIRQHEEGELHPNLNELDMGGRRQLLLQEYQRHNKHPQRQL